MLSGRAVQISPRMWELWPLLVSSYHSWAEDYLEHILVPLENYISRSAPVFLAGQNPNYLQQVRPHHTQVLVDHIFRSSPILLGGQKPSCLPAGRVS